VRIRLTFSRLPDARYARRLYEHEPATPQQKRVLLPKFTDDVIIVAVADDHPTVLTTVVLDEDGEPFGKTTEYKYTPGGSETVASDAPSLGTTVTTTDTSRPDVVYVGVRGAGGGEDAPAANSAPPANTEQAIPLTKSYRIRVGNSGETDAHETIEVGTVTVPRDSTEKVEVAVPVIPGQSDMEVFVQAVDDQSNREGEWVTTTIPQPDAEHDYVKVEDHDDSWGSGTIGKEWNYDTMVADAGNLVPKEVPSMFSTASGWADWSIFYNPAGDPPTGRSAFFSLDEIFPILKYEGAQVDQGVTTDFLPNIMPIVTDWNRTGKERSIFSTEEQYDMFRTHPRVLDERDPDFRYVKENVNRDMNWMGTTCNGAPLRCDQEWSPDGTTWYPWTWGDKITSRYYRFRLFMYAWRGISAAKLSNWKWWRWRRNRKFEFQKDYEPTSADGPFEFDIPQNVLDNTPIQREVVVSILDEDTSTWDDEITHTVVMLDPSASTKIKLIVTEIQRGVTTATAGAFTTTFHRGFGAAPRFVATAGDPTDYSYVGYDTISATQATGYYKYPASGGGVSNGAGDLHWTAYGYPKKFSLGGTVKIRVVVTGA
jgi:hypothetical protein